MTADLSRGFGSGGKLLVVREPARRRLGRLSASRYPAKVVTNVNRLLDFFLREIDEEEARRS
jgi:hypothetical protein